MTSLLGADLGSLTDLSAQLQSTTSGIGEVQASSDGVAQRVVDEMRAAFAGALSGISSDMAALESTVGQARSQTAQTQWTGSNRHEFERATGEFGAAMQSISAATDAAYVDFNAAMEQIAATINEYQAMLRTSLGQAQDSTTSMNQAVVNQREVLDQVMNTGLTVG